MIEDSLRYPFEADDPVKKGLYGSILTVAGLLVIPLFTLLGYMLRVMREDSMPEFDNLLGMTFEGFKTALVLTPYIAVPFVLVALLDGLAAFVLGVSSYLLVFYLMYSVLYQLSTEGWRAAFSLEVFRDAFSLNYFLGYLVAILVSSALYFAWFISLILIVTIFLMPTVYFYQYVFMFSIMAEAIESE